MLNELRKKIAHLPGGEDWIFERVVDGWPMGRIAEELGCSRGLLYDWWKRGPEADVARRTRKMEVARKLSAEALEEAGAKILDDLADEQVLTGTDVRLAEARAKYRQWQAESRDRERYGKGGGDVNVNLSIGELHLEALRRRGKVAVLEEPADDEAIEAPDYEVIEAPEFTTDDPEFEGEVEVEEEDDFLRELLG